jgi:2-polyprenyl-3-methyl-5-hydroxy-6-metoxy-1,4-benzoquinol methylase
MIWLDPIPLEEDIAKAYQEYFTHELISPGGESRRTFRRRVGDRMRAAYMSHRFKYSADAKMPFQWLLALPIIISRLQCDILDIPLRYLAVPVKGRMLDVGCGDGSVVKLAQNLGWDAEGLDFDPEAVKTAQRKGLKVGVGRVADQHYDQGSFDLVLMNHVIEHIHAPIQTLIELKRILKSTGTLVIRTPNADSWGHRYFGPAWAALDPPRHLYLFNGKNLVNLVERAGFPKYTISSTLSSTPFVFHQSRLILKSGHGDMTHSARLRDTVYDYAAVGVEMLMRMRNPLVASELLLEAHK